MSIISNNTVLFYIAGKSKRWIIFKKTDRFGKALMNTFSYTVKGCSECNRDVWKYGSSKEAQQGATFTAKVLGSIPISPKKPVQVAAAILAHAPWCIVVVATFSFFFFSLSEVLLKEFHLSDIWWICQSKWNIHLYSSLSTVVYIFFVIPN